MELLENHYKNLLLKGRDKIRFLFDMPGGIGNQLFGLFASRYFSMYTNCFSFPQFSTIDRHHNHLNFDIRTLDLMEYRRNSAERGVKPMIRNYLDKSFYYPSRSGPAKIIYRVRKHRFKAFPLNEDRLIHVNGYLDSLSTDNRSTLRVSGYFGDFAFYDSLSIENRKIELKHRSIRFWQIYNKIKSRRTLGIHLRLGDYLEHPETIGILSDDFYLNAIEAQKGKFEKILVFTNDYSEARRRINRWPFQEKICVLHNSLFSNPVEDLFLLSSCHLIVASNSTFSFWAAKLSESEEIYFPKMFRKDSLTQVENLPPEWKGLESYWL